MNSRMLRQILSWLLFTLIVISCTPEIAPPPVDDAGTIAVQLASVMLTQTAVAYSPTPPPTSTSLPVTEPS